MTSNDTQSASAPYDLESNRIVLIGLLLGTAGYGISLTLAIQCFARLFPHAARNRRKQVLLLYVCIMFTLSTIGNVLQIESATVAFITYHDYAGGPIAASHGPVGESPEAKGGTIIYTINSWFQDGLLLYRFWIIYSENYAILMGPTLLYMGTLVSSGFFIDQVIRPGQGMWVKTGINAGIPYWACSVGFTVVTTVLIIARLCLMRRRLQVILGKDEASPYISITAMLVESAFLWSSLGLLFLIFYSMENPLAEAFLPLLGQVTSITPLMIILRVAGGLGWRRHTVVSQQERSPSDLEFRAFTTHSTTMNFSIKDRINVRSPGVGNLRDIEQSGKPEAASVVELEELKKSPVALNDDSMSRHEQQPTHV